LAVPPRPLKEMMAECTESTIREFPFENQLSRNMGGLYIQLFELTSRIPLRDYTQLAAFTLAIRNFRFLQCVGDNIFDGYYEIGMANLRNVYENDLLATYLLRDEGESKRWWTGKYFRQGYLRKEVGHSNRMYSFLSNVFAHPNSVKSVTPLLGKIDKRVVSLKLYPEFDPKRCWESLQFYLMAKWTSILEFQYAFREVLWKNEKWKSDFIGWNEIVMKYIQEKIIKKSNMKFEFKDKLP